MKFNRKNIFISKSAIIGENVKIGDNVTIYDNVTIGDNSIICNDCGLGEPLNSYYFDEDYRQPHLKLGRECLIRSHCIIYAGSTFGDNLQLGHRVTIREKTTMGSHCSVGTLSDIQGCVSLGDYCRLHSNVHIGQKSKIGNFVFVYPYVVFTNDPTPPSNICIGATVDDYSQIATGAILLPDVYVGKNCLVGANAVVNKNVKEYSVVVGNPAKFLCDIREIKSKGKEGFHYPWMNNFSRGMPWDEIGYEKWLELNKNYESKND